MAIRSPFEGLRIPKDLVCEFFATFARFEFAMKEAKFVQKGKDYASPDWDRLAQEMGEQLKVEAGSEVAAAVEYLNAKTPQVQTPVLKWEARPLGGNTPVARAIHAAQRVRNNLFHGGKFTPHSPEGHDERLVQCSQLLITTCLEQNGGLRALFEQDAR